MNRFVKAAAILTGLASTFIGIAPVAAHHSGAMFDRTKVLAIKGVVKELRWVNPHVSISVYGTVEDGDDPEVWVFEMTSPGNLVRASGWQHDSVKPGDHVEVTFNPLRNVDERGGSLRTLLLVATGKKYTSNSIDQEQPELQ